MLHINSASPQGRLAPGPSGFFRTTGETLANDLKVWFGFNEAGGNSRESSVGTFSLPEFNGTVATTTGLFGNALNMTGDPGSGAPYLRSANFTLSASIWSSLVGTDPWSFQGWFYFNSWTTGAANPFVINSGTQNVLSIASRSANHFEVNRTGSLQVNMNPSLSEWIHCIIRYDGSDMDVTFNDGEEDGTTAAADPIADDSDVSCKIGIDGLVDLIGFWDRLLTDEEVTYLYNSGTGVDLGALL